MTLASRSLVRSGPSSLRLDIEDPLNSLSTVTTGNGTWSINTHLQCVCATSSQNRARSTTKLSAASMPAMEVEVEIPSGFAGATTTRHIRMGFSSSTDTITAGSFNRLNAGIRADGQIYWERDGVAGFAQSAYSIPTAGTWIRMRMMLAGDRATFWIDGAHVGEFQGVAHGEGPVLEFRPYVVMYTEAAQTVRFRNLKAWSYRDNNPIYS